MSVINSIFNLLRFNKKNWKAVVLCVFAAMIFWFFNALNKNYTTNITFPLAFEYRQEGYVPIRPLPDEIRINVTGNGWNLFRRSIGVKVPPLVIPLERPTEVKKIVGAALPALFSNQLDGSQINFVLTDTLYIAIEPRSTRYLSLKVDAPSILFRQGYGMTSPATITPDSILIEGPLGLIRSLAEPHYIKISERNIDEDFADDVELRFENDELIGRKTKHVAVKFSVDKLIVRKDSIRVVLLHLPNNVHPMIEVPTIPCEFAIPEPYLGDYHADSVKAIIDFKDIKRGETKFLPTISGLPAFTKIVRNDSIRLKF